MNQKIAQLVNKLPEPDERGFMSIIDKDVVDGVTEALIKDAPSSIVELIGMLKEPGDGDDYKAHYALT